MIFINIKRLKEFNKIIPKVLKDSIISLCNLKTKGISLEIKLLSKMANLILLPCDY
jgi:hypothetical protein